MTTIVRIALTPKEWDGLSPRSRMEGKRLSKKDDFRCFLLFAERKHDSMGGVKKGEIGSGR